MKRAVCWNLGAGAVLCLFYAALVVAFETIEGRPMDLMGLWFGMLLLSGLMYPISFVLTWVIDQRATWTFGDFLGRLVVTALSPLAPWLALGAVCEVFSAIGELIEKPWTLVVWLLLNR